jgi:large subunit ribosomal protein L18
MNKNKTKTHKRLKRKKRVRKVVFGTAQAPRLTTFRSLKNIYAQIIDDETGNTIVSANSMSEKLSDKGQSGSNIDAAKIIGEAIAKKAIEVGIREVKFDRNGYRYHGRVKALAESAREAGLAF